MVKASEKIHPNMPREEECRKQRALKITFKAYFMFKLSSIKQRFGENNLDREELLPPTLFHVASIHAVFRTVCCCSSGTGKALR